MHNTCIAYAYCLRKQSVIFVCIEDFENCALLGNYTGSSGNSLPMFRYVGKELPLLAA